MSPEERRARAFRIEALMREGDIVAAFEEVKAELTAQWQGCFDAVERDNLWRHVNAIDRVRAKIATYASLSSSDLVEMRRGK